MKQLRSLLRSVVEWLRPARRVQPEPRITPEQLRQALADMLADRETRSLVLKNLVGVVFPISGGQPVVCKSAREISQGDFGADCGGGTYSFPAAVGIGTSSPAPGYRLHVLGTPTDNRELLVADGTGETGGIQLGNYVTVQGHLDVDNNWNRALFAEGAYWDRNNNVYQLTNAPFDRAAIELLNGGHIAFFAEFLNRSGSPQLTPAQWMTLERMRITSGGNVGIGTTAPAEKLDVAGNIKCNGLNQIVFLRPLGAPNDDGNRINQAIDTLPDDGGIIYLLPGIFNIFTPVRNLSKRAVKLRGFGGAAIGFHAGLTILRWDPTSTDANKFVVRLESNITTDFMQDFEVSDLTIDGNAAAQIGLYLNRIASSKFINVHVQNLARPGAPSIGIKLTSLNGAADKGCLWNMFINCSVWGATRGLVLTGERDVPPVVANAAHNSFLGITVGYYPESSTSAGIFLGDCDNNSFFRPWVFALPPPPMQNPIGPGVLVQDPRIARANYFYHLQPPSPFDGDNRSFWVKSAPGFPTNSKNLVFGYDMENGQGQPRAFTDGTEVSPADFLFWVESKGNVHLSRASSGLTPVLDGTLEYFGSALFFTVGTTRHQLTP